MDEIIVLPFTPALGARRTAKRLLGPTTVPPFANKYLMRFSELEDLFSTSDLKQIGRRFRYLLIFGGVSPFCLAVISLDKLDITKCALWSLSGIGAAFQVWSWYFRRFVARLKTELEFSLPLVVERISMGAGAGLDVLSSIKAASEGGNDPASRLFGLVVARCESGLSLGEALDTVSIRDSSTAFGHTAVHLKLAHESGGEMLRSLRALSDSAQNVFQEGIEQQIAKLPARAVIPLMLAFAGLLIASLAIPIIQITNISKQAAEGSR